MARPAQLTPPATPFGAIARVARRAAQDASVIRWPTVKWREDPERFAYEALGVRLLWSAQIKLLESIRDHRNTSARSGHKCGKTTGIVIAALWFYSSFERAKVILTAVKADQIEKVIWSELQYRYRSAKIPLGGELYDSARSGLKADDGRHIWGLTARAGEGVAGISGPNVLVLFDEASGIHDKFFEVLGSSLAGSGGTVRKAYISNPTRTSGEFYRSHNQNKGLFNCIHISSADTPNARGVGEPIPGLAGPEWIAERAKEYGVTSARYKVRVLGEFVHDVEGKIISLDLIDAAELAWIDAPDDGRLQLGIDVAGASEDGDEIVMVPRRGLKAYSLLVWPGLTADALVENAVGTLRDHRRPRDRRPVVVLDAEGEVGDDARLAFQAYLRRHPDEFDLVLVRSSKKGPQRTIYARVRDELWVNLREWMKAGGGIPEDAKLAEELNAPSLIRLERLGLDVVTSKDQLRAMLERSPDRADALCLAVWEPNELLDEQEPTVQRRGRDDVDEGPDRDDVDEDLFVGTDHDRLFDPYRG